MSFPGIPRFPGSEQPKPSNLPGLIEGMRGKGTKGANDLLKMLEDDEPKLPSVPHPPGSIELTPEEQAAVDERIKETSPSHRKREYISWAESFGKDADWVTKIFTFNPDGTVVVEESLDLSSLGIDHLPKGLIKVTGYLELSFNQLTSLGGLPQTIGGNLGLSHNQLTSLEGLPQTIGGYLSLSHNQLTSLEGLLQTIGGELNLSYNQLTSLEGLPQTIGGNLLLCDISATEIPRGLKIGGKVYIKSSQTALIQDARKKGYKVIVLTS